MVSFDELKLIVDTGSLMVLIITLFILIWQINELKKSTRIQAYQNVLSNYIASVVKKGEPSYDVYFKDESVVTRDDFILFSTLMNTFEMLDIQHDQKIVPKEVWETWKTYFIFIIKNKYRHIWELLKNEKYFHEDLTKLINDELNIP